MGRKRKRKEEKGYRERERKRRGESYREKEVGKRDEEQGKKRATESKRSERDEGRGGGGGGKCYLLIKLNPTQREGTRAVRGRHLTNPSTARLLFPPCHRLLVAAAPSGDARSPRRRLLFGALTRSRRLRSVWHHF